MILSDQQITKEWWSKSMYLTELRESHLKANAMIRDLNSKMERAKRANALLRDIVDEIQDHFIDEYGKAYIRKENIPQDQASRACRSH
jgi:hypothetical protein